MTANDYNLSDFFELIKNSDLKDLNNLLQLIQNLIKGGYEEIVLEVINSWYKRYDKESICKDLFFKLCLYEDLNGTKYIRNIIMETNDDNEFIDKQISYILDIIARKNNTTSSRVLKSIRDVIKFSWEDMDENTKLEIFPKIDSKPKLKRYIKYVCIYYNNLVADEPDIEKVKRLAKK